MYFVPILFASAAMLIYPSWTVGGVVALLSWFYLQFAGRKLHREELSTITTELAFRTLSVKALAINGDYDDITYDVHQVNTPDLPENSIMRARLRNAAGASHDGWKEAARRVRRGAKNDPAKLHTLLNGLVIQLTSQPSARTPVQGVYNLTKEVQLFLLEVAKMWGIGPNNLRSILDKRHVPVRKDIAFK